MSAQIRITKPSYLAAASRLASKDDSRYYLKGVSVEPNPEGGIFLVATDGHGFVIFKDTDGYVDRPYILPVSADLFKHTKHDKKDKFFELRCIEASGSVLRVLHAWDDWQEDLYTQKFEPIDAHYPSWDKIVSDLTARSDIGLPPLDTSLVWARFASVLDAAFGRSTRSRTKAGTPSGHAVRFVAATKGGNPEALCLVLGQSSDWFGIAMPLVAKKGGAEAALSEPPFSPTRWESPAEQKEAA